MNSKVNKLAFAIVAMLTGSVAMAAVSTGALTATATVLASCTIGSPTLAFGIYDPTIAADLDASTTVSVSCTNTTTYSIYSTTPFANRVMISGAGGAGQVLTFGVYGSIANRTGGAQLPLTNTTGSVAGTGSGLPQTVTLYGRIPASQNVLLGAYSNAAATTNLTIEY